jgi:hypothetical protein
VPDNDRVVTTFTYAIDTASTKAVTALLDDTRKRMLTVDQAGAQINKNLADLARVKAIDNISVQARQAAIESGRWSDGLRLASQQLSAVGASDQELKRVTTQIAAAATETNLLYERYKAVKAEIASTPDVNLPAGGASIRGGRGGTLGQLGTQLYNLPDVQIAGGFSTTEMSRGLIIADKLQGALGVSTGALAVGAGLAIPAIVGMTAVIAEQQRQYEEATKQTQEYLNKQVQLNELVLSGGTSEAIGQRIDDLRIQRDAKQAAIDLYAPFAQEFNAIIQRFNTNPIVTGFELGQEEQVGALNQRLSEASQGQFTNVRILIESLRTYEEEVKKFGVDIGLAEIELSSAAVAANDLIDATRTQVERELELADLRRTASSEQIRDQLAANQEQADALARVNVRLRQESETAANAGDVEAWQALTGEITANTLQILALGDASEELTNQVLPAVEALEALKRAEQGRTDQNQAYLDALEQEADARQAVQDAQQAINDELTKFADKQDDIATTLGEAEEKARITRSKALSELDKKVIDDRKELEAKAGEDQIKALRDHLKRRDEITRKADLSLLDAQRTRDVVAGIRATEARDEALRKEGDSLQERIDTINDNLKKQNEVVDDRLKEQKAVIEDRYQDQLKTALDAANKATRIENDRHIRQLVILQQAANRADVQLMNTLNAQQMIYRNHFTSVGSVVGQGLLNVANLFKAAVDRIQANVATLSQARATATTQYAAPIGPNPASGPSINLNPFSPILGSTYNNPFSFTTAPRSATVNNIQITTATNKREVKALSNSEARTVLGQYLED